MKQPKKITMDEITAAFTQCNELYEGWAKSHGLSYNALMILYTLDKSGGCTQKDICQKWLIPKQTVHSILNDYKAKDYVVYEPDPQDKRGKIVRLTTAGHDYADPILKKLYRIEDKTLEKMGEELCSKMLESNLEFCKYFAMEAQNE